MTPYFDPTNQNDVNLLPPRLRDATADITWIAPLVEAEIKEEYTIAVNPLLRGWYASPYRVAVQTATNSNRWVFLSGYTLDAADPTADPALVTALKRTIALVIAHRLAQLRIDPMVQTEAESGTKSVTHHASALDPWPPYWSRLLDNFDVRERW